MCTDEIITKSGISTHIHQKRITGVVFHDTSLNPKPELKPRTYYWFSLKEVNSFKEHNSLQEWDPDKFRHTKIVGQTFTKATETEEKPGKYDDYVFVHHGKEEIVAGEFW